MSEELFNWEDDLEKNFFPFNIYNGKKEFRYIDIHDEEVEEFKNKIINYIKSNFIHKTIIEKLLDE